MEMEADDRGLWCRVLKSKYDGRYHENASTWWKDLFSICYESGSSDWFDNSIRRKMGDGNSTPFWSVDWSGHGALKERFPRLFNLSNQQQARVSEVGLWEDGVWQWKLEWRRPLFGRELGMYDHLIPWLSGFTPCAGQPDRWAWVKENSGVFTVSSAYDILRGEFEDLEGKEVYTNLWATKAPSNLIALAWKVLLNRVQTKINLRRRNALPPSVPTTCVLCLQQEESSSHLFFSCPLSSKLWKQVYGWFGLCTVLPDNGEDHFSQHVIGNKKMDNIYRMIWVATVASIWSLRNRIVFKDGIANIEGILESIQYQTWLWCKVKVGGFYYSIFEWTMNPLVCLNSVNS